MLFIAAEDQSAHALTPGYFPYAVFGGKVSGENYDRHITFDAPANIPLYGMCLPMFSQDGSQKALWLQVARVYTGKPRIIGPTAYTRIWEEWFFEPCGERYDPWHFVQLPVTGESMPMGDILSVYRMLQRLMHVHPDEYAHLALVAHDKKRSVVPNNCVLSWFARRPFGLRANEEISARHRNLLVELLTFNPSTQQISLIKPWRPDGQR